MYMYVYIYINHCVVYLKLTWHCKWTILQLKKWGLERQWWFAKIKQEVNIELGSESSPFETLGLKTKQTKTLVGGRDESSPLTVLAHFF